MRYVIWVSLAAWAAVVAAFLHYTLPQTDIVRITGVEVVRVDTGGLQSCFYSGPDVGAADVATRDVRFVNAVDADRRARVYRNQDTGWGWPPYFKFDSADLQAEATDRQSTLADDQWVAVRHYGWRSQLLSIYPNVLSIRDVDGPDATVIPWLNIVVLTLLAALAWGVTVRVIRWRRRAAEGIGDAVDDGRRWFRRRRR
jgi:hypothetical protein